MFSKRRMARRDFLKLAAASGISSYFLSSCRPSGKAGVSEATEADTIVTNGRIATADDRRSFAEAVAIANGRFIAVGTAKEVMAYKGNRTQVIDVTGVARLRH